MFLSREELQMSIRGAEHKEIERKVLTALCIGDESVISWYHVINNDLGLIEMVEPFFFSLSYDFGNWKLLIITEIAGQGCNSSNSQNCLSSALHGLEPHEPTKYFCRWPCMYSTTMVGFHHQAVVVWNIQEISLCSGKSICLSIAFPL